MTVSTQTLAPRATGRAAMPRLPGMGTLALGEKVRVRRDRRIWTVTGKGEIATTIVLTLEHLNIFTGENTTIFVPWHQVTVVEGF